MLVALVIGLLFLVLWFVLLATVDLDVGVGAVLAGAAAGVLAAAVSGAVARRRN